MPRTTAEHGGMGFEPTRYIYEQVADLIAADIASGRLPKGARLPNERDLGKEYGGVAPGTARRAVRELRERGLVVTLPNRGTFVVDTPDSDGADGR